MPDNEIERLGKEAKARDQRVKIIREQLLKIEEELVRILWNHLTPGGQGVRLDIFKNVDQSVLINETLIDRPIELLISETLIDRPIEL